MSKVHVLAGNGSTYSLIIHTNTPAGNNAVGNTWKAALLAGGVSGSTILPTGTAIGQITSSEAASIAAGDVLEFQASIASNPNGSNPTTGQLTSFADSVIAAEFDRLQVAYKFYGYAQ